MEQIVEKADLVQQEPTKPENQEVLKLDVEVAVAVEGDEATIALPPEIRLTERLVAYLAQALNERGLKLRHWTLTPEQQEELKKLSNVVVEEKAEEQGD